MHVPVGEAVSVPASPIPVVVSDESNLVRTPGLAHPCMAVPSEVRDIGGVSTTMPDGSQANAVFPSIAIYCQPPSPTVSVRSYSRSPSPMQYSPYCQSQSGSRRQTASSVEEAVAAVKKPVCARLSVPTDGPPRRRTASGSLSRSQSHPLHRHRHRSRPSTSNVDQLPTCSQQTEQQENVVERTTVT